MNNHTNDTALITGANSGIGFETAALLAEGDWGQVILACRTDEKGAASIALLEERTGRKVFEALTVDVSELESVDAAVKVLADRSSRVDFLLLNAGVMTGPPPVHNSQGVEVGFAVANVGHHRLTMRMRDHDLLGARARIVIAGSEAARGDVPMMKIPDFNALAAEKFQGDLAAAMEAMACANPNLPFQANASYAVSKSFSVWWASALAERLPSGMTVNAVSPGSAPASNFGRNMAFLARNVMMPLMKLLGPLMGMAGPLDVAAGRYVAAADYSDEQSGGFYASPAGKLVGPVELHTQPHLVNDQYRQACWEVLIKLSGGVGYPA